MDKKLWVFSIFVSLFILGGMSFVSATAGNGTLHSIGGADGTAGRAAVNTSFGNVAGGTTVTLNFHITPPGTLNNTHFVTNLTVFYNTSMTVFAKATLTGVSGNTTCSSNVCTNASGRVGSFVVSWTLPTTDGSYRLIPMYGYRTVPGPEMNVSLNLVNVDNTKPTVTLVGNMTDAFVFTSASRFLSNYPAQAIFMRAKVSDRNVRNCTMWTDARYATTKASVIAVNKSGLNTVAAAGGFINDSTAGTVKFFNATPRWMLESANVLIANDKFKWGVSCYDNATTPNYGVDSTNRTFYFDNSSPKMANTNPLVLEDSDPNAKDTSSSGLFTIGGVWTSELLETLKFTCNVDEDNIGKVTFFVKDPGSSIFTDVGSSTSKTFDFKKTNAIGLYEVYCSTDDIAGNSTKSITVKFRLQAEDEGEVKGTAPYVKPFNVDFSKVDTKNIVEPEGRILTVSFDGKTEHTVNFQRVTATSVTLVITSTPKTLNLNIGDTKNVDVNDDGVDDFAVSLVSIIEGKANVAFKKLTGAAQVAREESGQPATTVSAGTGPTTSGRSMTGIWIVVLIVVVGVIIYLVVARRKKK